MRARSLSYLELNRAEVEQFIEEAEDQFYEIFNTTVDDDDFKDQLSPRDTNRLKTSLSGFVSPSLWWTPGHVMPIPSDSMPVVGSRSIRTAVEPQYQQLQQRMEQMTQEIPAFAQIASILAQLRARREQLLN